jgi:hypothetical protein
MSAQGALPLTNQQVADRLEEVADLLEARDDNPFRVRAYRTAADAARGLRRPAHEVLAAEGLGGLTRLPGIGDVLARAMEELTATGRLKLLDQLRGEAEPEQLLATVPGIGPGLAGRIHRQLGIESLAGLEQAAHDGRLGRVPGLGAKRLQAIRDSLAGRLRRRPRPPATTMPAVGELLEVDRLYREQAGAGRLRLIAPARFNPAGRPWLPVLRTRRGGRRYTALYSNTAQAHRLGATRDWVVLYWGDDGREGQATVVTARAGPLKGRRVVRGREVECAEHYAERPADVEPSGAAGQPQPG